MLAAAEAGPLDQLEHAQVDLVRGQVAFASSAGSEAAALLLKAAKRIEPLDVGLARQRDRALEKRGRRGNATARLRPPSRQLELGRDLFIWPRCRRGQMPGTTIGIELPVSYVRQRLVRRPALRQRRRPVHR